MIAYNPNKPLISIHIPKTGGISFRNILSLWFGDKLMFHYYDERKGEFPVKHNLAPGCCVHGHFNRKRGFGVDSYYPEADQFITFLRDPFEILISRYFYVKRNELAGMSFRDGNLFTLPEGVNDFLEKEIINPNYHPNILDYFPVPINHSNYKNIIDNQFVFIGFADKYQESIKRLSAILGLPVPDVGIENASERSETVDYNLKDFFIKQHPLEYEVYNYAKNRLVF